MDERNPCMTCGTFSPKTIAARAELARRVAEYRAARKAATTRPYSGESDFIAEHADALGIGEPK